MGATAGVIFDSLDQMRARREALEVDGPDTPLHAATVVPYRHPSSVVSAALRMTFLRECQWQKRPSLPQMVVDRSLEMSLARRSRLIDAENSRVLAHSTGIAIDRFRLRFADSMHTGIASCKVSAQVGMGADSYRTYGDGP